MFNKSKMQNRCNERLLIYGCLFIFLICEIEGQCAMRGLCHEHHHGAYGPCVPLENSTFDTYTFSHDHLTFQKLKKYCSHLIDENSNKSTQLCCTPKQADGLVHQIAQAEAILSRCPSCFDNFAKLWCEFTCSPRQDSFLKVIESKPITPKPNFTAENEYSIEYANRLEYHVSKKFVVETFNSCKDVTFGGAPALRIMCTSTPCTLDSWLKFIGKQNLQLNIPVYTDFVLENDNDLKMAEKNYAVMPFTRCNESVRPGVSPCSKMECNKEEFKSLINIDDGKTSVEVCKVHGIACMKIFIILVFFASLVIITCVSQLLQATDPADVEGFRRAQSGERLTQEGRVKRTGAWIQRSLEFNSREIGKMAGRKPKTFILVGFSILFLCLPGMVYHKESRNVLDMWSSPTSRARVEEDIFNMRFGRESRYQQIMLVSNREFRNDGLLYGAVFDQDIVEELFHIENAIKNLSTIDKDGRVITLDDVCYRPMGAGFDCLIMSPSNYFQGDIKKLQVASAENEEDEYDYFSSNENTPGWQTHINECVQQEYSQNTSVGLSCFGSYGGPSAPNMIFGRKENISKFAASTAIMVTIALTQRDQTEIDKAELWEAKLLEFAKNYSRHITLPRVMFSFMAERSIMDEIENDGKAEIVTIVIALVFLIGYVMFSLGRYFVCENQLTSILVHSRLILGCSSVLINTLSSFCSWGLFSMMGIHPVKNALVVQFFLVTLLGVSRTFMVVKHYAHLRVTTPYMGPSQLPKVVGNVMAGTMPALFSSSLSCVVCFLIGSVTNLPAIRSFCLYAGLAIFIDVLLHCTIFLALFSWDTQREINGRAEILYYYKIKDLLGAYLCGRQRATDTFMSHLFKSTVAPFLMKKPVRILTGFIFISSFISSIVLSSKVDVGFDQSMAFTENSYVSTHFRYLDKLMNVGPLVYFVVEGELDWHKPEVQNKFCTLPSCNDTSLGNILQFSIQNSHMTSLVNEVFNWVDTYLQWISRDSPCCKVYVHDPNTFCSTNRNATIDGKDCRSCMDYDDVANSYPKGSIEYERPSKEFFYKYIHYFLDDNPNSVCVFGGRASFKSAISFTSRGRIQASHFMTFFRKLKLSNSTDFVVAMEHARMVARRLERSIDTTANIFAYSKFFPFYEQYSTILQTLTTQLISTIAGVFGIIGLTLGIDMKGASCAVICKISNYFHIVAFMYVFGIQVNAISATILIMSSGMLIEFSANVLAAYTASTKILSRDRAEETIANVGAIILSGPVMTMAGSTMFLSGAHLQIINVYFFQLVMITILSSAVHALIFLPLLLSFGGSRSHRNRNVVMQGPHSGVSHMVPQSADFHLGQVINEHENDGDCDINQRQRCSDLEKLLDPLLAIEKEVKREGVVFKTPIDQVLNTPPASSSKTAPYAEIELESE